MIKVTYTELDGPSGPTLRLEAAGHAGYAPAGQDIVCAGASTLMQTLVYLLAGEESAKSDAWDEPEGPRLAVTAAAPQKPWVEGAFEFAKAGFALLAERYPDNVRFADLSGRGEQCMVDLQLFAEGEGGAAPPPAPAPALSRAQQQQAIASGTMKVAEAEAPAKPLRETAVEEAGAAEQPEPAAEPTAPEMPETRLPPRLPAPGRGLVEQLHAQWAAEEALLRRDVPGFSLKAELRDPEMRRLMQLPGMRLGGCLPSCPLQRCPAPDGPDRGAGGGGADPAAGLPPGGKRHPPRQRGGDQSGRGQHDPGPEGSVGAAGAARGANQVLTSHRCGLASPAPCGAPLTGEPGINVRGDSLF